MLLFSVFGLTACGGNDSNSSALTYEQITQAEAKAIMDSGVECIIIDTLPIFIGDELFLRNTSNGHP